MTLSLDHLEPQLSRSLGIPRELLAQSFRPATASDIPQVLELRRLVSGQVWWNDEAYVRWRYLESRPDDQPLPYWVFERNGEFIAGIGLEPVALIVDGQPQPAIRAMDVMVRPDLDGRGLGVLMNLLLFRHFPVVLVAGSNARSHNLVSRMFDQALELRTWKALARSRDFIQRHVSLGPLIGMAAAAGDAMLSLGRARRRNRSSRHLELRELMHFDDQVAALSKACEGERSVLVRRSAEYLNWRFMRNPRCQYRIQGGFEDDRLVGYVVSRLTAASLSSRREGVIADWLAVPQGEGKGGPLPFILQAAVDRLIVDGAHLVRCLAYGTSVGSLVEPAGFRLRPEERIAFFVHASDPVLHQRLVSGGGWFLTGCDYDVE